MVASGAFPVERAVSDRTTLEEDGRGGLRAA